MRYKLGLIFLSVLVLTVLVLTIPALAQQQTTTDEKLAKLRLELIDVQGKEDSLRARAKQLDEDIKPDNIARSLAGYGSTKPEELREFRRRQIELERNKVLQQLEALSAKRSQLESAIARAETQAYHESAQPKDSTLLQSFVARVPNSRPLLLGLAGGAFAALGGALFLIRRFKSSNSD